MKRFLRQAAVPAAIAALLAACAPQQVQLPEPCPPGATTAPACPPAGAVSDPFIDTLHDNRRWVTTAELGEDPIELAKRAEIEPQPARTRFYGPSDDAALDSLAAKLWMIENARHTIDFAYYIFRPDFIGQAMLGALCSAARRGVDVRVMVDAMGSWSLSHDHLRALQTCGETAGFMRDREGRITDRRARVQVVLLNALTRLAANPNRRLHDKLLVVDGHFPVNAMVLTGGRNISQDYYGLREDGTRDADPFRDAELLVRHDPEAQPSGRAVGELAEAYASVLFLLPKNRPLAPGRGDQQRAHLHTLRKGHQEALQALHAMSLFRASYREMPVQFNEGLHRSTVRLVHELGNLTDRQVVTRAPDNIGDNPNSILHVLDQIVEWRPDVQNVRIISPYLFLARYEDEEGQVMIDEAAALLRWLEEHPKATLEIITNSVLTSDNVLTQAVIDLETAPRLLFSESMREAWIDVAGEGEDQSELVRSEEWRRRTSHPRIFIYETGRLDSVLLGRGDANYGKLHAKVYLEHDLGFIGTSNFDYRSRLYNNEMGYFFLDAGLAGDVHQAFEALRDISYRWGSPEWLELRKQVREQGGMKGLGARNQRRLYQVFSVTGLKWLL